MRRFLLTLEHIGATAIGVLVGLTIDLVILSLIS